jgi:hypothetical protein
MHLNPSVGFRLEISWHDVTELVCVFFRVLFWIFQMYAYNRKALVVGNFLKSLLDCRWCDSISSSLPHSTWDSLIFSYLLIFLLISLVAKEPSELHCNAFHKFCRNTLTCVRNILFFLHYWFSCLPEIYFWQNSIDSKGLEFVTDSSNTALYRCPT